MGDNLRMAHVHPDCESRCICDPVPARMLAAQADLGLAANQLFTDWQTCLQAPSPILFCSAQQRDHALWVERLAPTGIPILLEKPMAASLAQADRMIEACEKHRVTLAINWPLVWVPSHRTAKRLITEGRIGDLIEVHYYDGNRGPLWHTAGKLEITAEQVAAEKLSSWFYKSQGRRRLAAGLPWLRRHARIMVSRWPRADRSHLRLRPASGPRSRRAFHHDRPLRIRVSKFETRWGTFTDPWTHQPQPKCGLYSLVRRARSVRTTTNRMC